MALAVDLFIISARALVSQGIAGGVVPVIMVGEGYLATSSHVLLRIHIETFLEEKCARGVRDYIRTFMSLYEINNKPDLKDLAFQVASQEWNT
jgi:hypothetical protein